MKTQHQNPELPIIVPNFFFVHLSEDYVGKSKPSNILPLIKTISEQNGLNLNISRQYNIALGILDKSVIRN